MLLNAFRVQAESGGKNESPSCILRAWDMKEEDTRDGSTGQRNRDEEAAFFKQKARIHCQLIHSVIMLTSNDLRQAVCRGTGCLLRSVSDPSYFCRLSDMTYSFRLIFFLTPKLSLSLSLRRLGDD